MIAKTLSEKEEIRHAVRTYLYDRAGVAQPAHVITRHLIKDGHRCDKDDIEIALGFLVGMGLINEIPDELGGTKYFRINSDGMLSHERSGALS